MADLTTTQLKLRTTPTAGVAGEQSPYYRRLLSAGYKGFLQGTVGGSTLYGLIGAGIGLMVALPVFFALGGFAAPAALAAFALVPAVGGLGLYKGAGTFGNIGSFAAITAESAEMSEKRRYLLDRYYDLPDTPEFDGEAEQIRTMLAKQHDSKPPKSMFHWKTVMVGAALGAVVALGFMALPGMAALVGEHLFFGALPEAMGASATLLSAGAMTVIGTTIGALAGGVLGLDRFYVRNWLDQSANLMQDRHAIEEQLIEREREIQQLGVSRDATDISRMPVTEVKKVLPPTHDEEFKINISDSAAPARDVEESHPHGTTRREAPITPGDIAGLGNARDVEESHPHGTTRREMPISPRDIAGLGDTPSTIASQIHHDRKVSLEQALHNPVL